MDGIIGAMKQWLDGDIGRSVEVRGHCSGFRVTLCDMDGHVSSCTASTFNAALKGALDNEPGCGSRRAREMLEAAQRELANGKRSVDLLHKKVAKLRRECRAGFRKGLHNAANSR